MKSSSVKSGGRSNAFVMPGSFLNPKFKLDKIPALNPLANLNLASKVKFSDEKPKSTRNIDLLKGSRSQHASVHLLTPSRGITSEKNLLQQKIFRQFKTNRSPSPLVKSARSMITDSKRLGISEQYIGDSILDQEQISLRSRKLPEPNELKTMDHIIGQLKKQSHENLANGMSKVSAEYYNTDKIIRKNNGHISVHLNNAIAESQGEFRKAEPPLNDLILKKLGLDPATKERQESHFVSSTEQDFSSNIRFRKRTIPSLSSPKEKNLMPNDISGPLRSGSVGLLSAQNTGSDKKLQQLQFLNRKREGVKIRGISQLYRGDIKSCEQPPSNENILADITVGDPENLSSIDLNPKIAEVDECNNTGRSLLLQELDVKDAPDFAQAETLQSNRGSQERCHQETKGEDAAAMIFSESKGEITTALQQSSRMLQENEKLALKQIVLRANHLLMQDRIKQDILIQENQRLMKENQELKMRLKLYEENNRKTEASN